MKDYFKEKEEIPVVLVSRSKEDPKKPGKLTTTTRIFPIKKERQDGKHKFIEGMTLIKETEDNFKKLDEDGEVADGSELLEAFYLYSEEFEKDQDSLVVCR